MSFTSAAVSAVLSTVYKYSNVKLLNIGECLLKSPTAAILQQRLSLHKEKGADK